MEAIFDIKTLRIDKNEDFYSETRRTFRRAVDTKVERVRRLYMLAAEKLDIKCGANYTTHPFSEALKNNFNSGGVHPVVFGAFGETNEASMRMIKKCAKYPAARSENADVTPLNNTLQKGTAYHIMLTQFRRALGVLAVRTATLQSSSVIGYGKPPSVNTHSKIYAQEKISMAETCHHPSPKKSVVQRRHRTLFTNLKRVFLA